MESLSSVSNDVRWSSVINRNQPLILRLKNVKHGSATTKRVLEQKIKSSDLSVAVNKVNCASSRFIDVEYDNNESNQRLQTKAVAERSIKNDVEISNMMNPKINVVTVREEYLREEDVIIKG